MADCFFTATYLIPDRRAQSVTLLHHHDRRSTNKKLKHDYIEITRDFFLPSEQAVRFELISMGATPLSINRREHRWYHREVITKAYRLSFLRSVAFHVMSGVSAGNAISAVINGEENTRKRLELEPSLDVISRGGSITDALDSLNIFDTATIAMLKAGEASGTMVNAIDTAVQHMENKQAAWRSVASVFTWLYLETGLAISSLISVQYSFIPWLASKGVKSDDPVKIKEFNDSIELATTLNGILLAIGIFGVIFALTLKLMKYTRNHETLDAYNRIMYHMPLVGKLMIHQAMEETTLITGKMLSTKVRFVEAASIAIRSSKVKAVSQLWETAVNRVKNGSPLSWAMNSPVMSKAEIHEIKAHQNLDQLSKVLVSISSNRGFLADRVRFKLSRVGIFGCVLYMTLSGAIIFWLIIIQSSGLENMVTGAGGIM